MELILVQHGESKSEAEDPERSLTEQGAEAVRRMAAWAEQVGLKVGQIRHSGKRRAEQTAQLLAERLQPPKRAIDLSGLNPNDDVRPIAAALIDEEDTVMLVGHLPFLSRLASLLVTGDPETGVVSFCYAGLVCLKREGRRWSVNWVMVPDLLAPAAARH